VGRRGPSKMNVFQHCKWLRVFGSLMVLMVLSIVGISAYSIVLVCQARTKHGPPSMYPLGITVMVVFAAMAVMMLWSYFACVLTDPGTVPHGWQPFADRATSSGSLGASGASSPRPLGARWCKRCLKWKPDRCHHCSVCGRCVLKMDHHCVWVVNCVGGANYKFFLLFLFYTCIIAVFSTAVLLPFIISTFVVTNSFGNTVGLTDDQAACVFISMVLDVAFAFSVFGFLAMHITLVLSNTTTIEMYEKKRLTPWRYDKGRRANFTQVFGSWWPYYFIPMHFEEDRHLIDEACGLVDSSTRLPPHSQLLAGDGEEPDCPCVPEPEVACV